MAHHRAGDFRHRDDPTGAPHRLWAAATLWLGAHAAFHLWEVAVGICSPSVILRDFPAVTLTAIIGAVLTLWAIRQSRAGRTASA